MKTFQPAEFGRTRADHEAAEHRGPINILFLGPVGATIAGAVICFSLTGGPVCGVDTVVRATASHPAPASLNLNHLDLSACYDLRGKEGFRWMSLGFCNYFSNGRQDRSVNEICNLETWISARYLTASAGLPAP